ncbi:MAG: hypothetical protein JWP67_1496 [Mucilaginibacter sp.]|nr:hypothetical protein [Mucilaginibacter sp.]
MSAHANIIQYFYANNMAKQLSAIFIPGIFGSDRLDELPVLLDTHESHLLDNHLWADNTYTPKVNFTIAYTVESILLKYNVIENELIANYREINDPVYHDSCVEFFIKFDKDVNYYNLEFNCMGTALVGYGSGKYERITIPKEAVSKIKSRSHIRTMEGGIHWQLSLIIPFSVLVYHSFTSLKNKSCSANFYKCGDKMTYPHFLSWNNIDHPSPNFHLPEFMGKINFIV